MQRVKNMCAQAQEAQPTVRNAARLAVYEDRMMMQNTPYASATMRTAQLRLRGCGICGAVEQQRTVRPLVVCSAA